MKSIVASVEVTSCLVSVLYAEQDRRSLGCFIAEAEIKAGHFATHPETSSVKFRVNDDHGDAL